MQELSHLHDLMGPPLVIVRRLRVKVEKKKEIPFTNMLWDGNRMVGMTEESDDDGYITGVHN